MSVFFNVAKWVTGRVFPKYLSLVSRSQDATRRGYFRAEHLGFKRLVLNFEYFKMHPKCEKILINLALHVFVVL